MVRSDNIFFTWGAVWTSSDLVIMSVFAFELISNSWADVLGFFLGFLYLYLFSLA